jgi:hypothetical protein
MSEAAAISAKGSMPWLVDEPIREKLKPETGEQR